MGEKVNSLIANYILFIAIGFLIAVGSLVKLLSGYDFSSDWFWALAGFGLMIEGIISFIKQKKFDRKYKIIERTDKKP